MTLCCLEGKTNGMLKFQCHLLSAFGVIAIENKKRKTVDMYSAIWGKKLQVLV